MGDVKKTVGPSLAELQNAREQLLHEIAVLEVSIVHSWGSITHEMVAFIEQKRLILTVFDEVVREARSDEDWRR